LTLLARRGLVAACGVALAAAIHPAPPSVPLAAISALTLLLVAALLAAPRDPAGRVVGLGALAVAVALGYDGLRGHRGTLTLDIGQGARSFEEEGPDGRTLGLRPLGFDVVLERIEPDGGVVLSVQEGAAIVVGARRAARYGGFRFGAAERVGTEPSALRIAVAGRQGTRVVDVRTDAPATVDGFEISVERYFPDFALDEKQQPFSRSSEPRNPAVLLRVTRGTAAWRVFVIRALPGIHRPEGLDLSLSLTEVVTRESAAVRVSREPAGAVALAGVMLMALGIAWGSRPA
jgi:hypothetical protein